MGQFLKTAPEQTIWALRKNAVKNSDPDTGGDGSLYTHLFGYDPIRFQAADSNNAAIRKGSAENPQLNIINPKTNFVLVEIASVLPPEEA